MNLGLELIAASVPRFTCGHKRVPKNAAVVMVDGKLTIRCLECKRTATREYDQRKGKRK
jgi:hypothetical protein